MKVIQFGKHVIALETHLGVFLILEGQHNLTITANGNPVIADMHRTYLRLMIKHTMTKEHNHEWNEMPQEER